MAREESTYCARIIIVQRCDLKALGEIKIPAGGDVIRGTRIADRGWGDCGGEPSNREQCEDRERGNDVEELFHVCLFFVNAARFAPQVFSRLRPRAQRPRSAARHLHGGGARHEVEVSGFPASWRGDFSRNEGQAERRLHRLGLWWGRTGVGVID